MPGTVLRASHELIHLLLQFFTIGAITTLALQTRKLSLRVTQLLSGGARIEPEQCGS